MGVFVRPKRVVLTPALQQLLAHVGADRGTAVSSAQLERHHIITRPSEGLRKLLMAGWATSERRLDPAPGPNGTTAARLWYWRTPEGTAQLAAAGDCPVAPPPEPKPLDDSGLLHPSNTTRAAVTFRETMAAWGLEGIAAYYALPDRAARDAFHADWTARMYRDCALAGEPIPENPPYERHEAGVRRRPARPSRDDD